MVFGHENVAVLVVDLSIDQMRYMQIAGKYNLLELIETAVSLVILTTG
jgi:hypothetical protein